MNYKWLQIMCYTHLQVPWDCHDKVFILPVYFRDYYVKECQNKGFNNQHERKLSSKGHEKVDKIPFHGKKMHLEPK